MKPKTITILYWIFTIFFALLMLMDGISGVMRVDTGKEVMQHLGYPEYVLTIFGTAKILGAIAIVQNKYQTIKEWAYAGFAFNFIGALASRGLAGDAMGEVLFPIIGLVIMLIPYFLWKRVEQLETT